MKRILFCIFLLNIIYLVFSKNKTYDNCWKRRNLCITIDDLPSLLKHFTLCLEKCEQLNNEECFNDIISQLKSSKLVLRQLYYHGQIGFWIIQEHNDLYNKAMALYPACPKLISNWLVVKNKNYSVLYDLEAMMAEEDEHICNELITKSIEFYSYGVLKLIPIPSFDVKINPHYLILPYKRDFIIEVNNSYQNSIIYKAYFQSMKCVNIINKRNLAIDVNKSLNKHFVHWIVKTVIPVASSTSEIMPTFGAVFRILKMANEFEKQRVKSDNADCNSKLLGGKTIDNYPNMAGLLQNNNTESTSCEIFGESLKSYYIEYIIIFLTFLIGILIIR